MANTTLTKEGPNAWFGWKPDLPDVRDNKYKFAPRLEDTQLPDIVDLRGDINPVMPIRSQLQLGACTAFGVGDTYEWAARQHNLRPYLTSALFIYYNERLIEGTVAEDSGAMIRTGLKVVTSIGAAPDKYWPYKVERFTHKPTKTSFTYAARHPALIYQRLEQRLNDLRSCLAQKLSFAFGYMVYESFDSQQVNKTGYVPMPQTTEKDLGGHCTTLVGFDHPRRLFIGRNQWDKDWGDQGYFYMPYDYILNYDLAADFWTISLVK